MKLDMVLDDTIFCAVGGQRRGWGRPPSNGVHSRSSADDRLVLCSRQTASSFCIQQIFTAVYKKWQDSNYGIPVVVNISLDKWVTQRSVRANHQPQRASGRYRPKASFAYALRCTSRWVAWLVNVIAGTSGDWLVLVRTIRDSLALASRQATTLKPIKPWHLSDFYTMTI